MANEIKVRIKTDFAKENLKGLNAVIKEITFLEKKLKELDLNRPIAQLDTQSKEVKNNFRQLSKEVERTDAILKRQGVNTEKVLRNLKKAAQVSDFGSVKEFQRVQDETDKTIERLVKFSLKYKELQEDTSKQTTLLGQAFSGLFTLIKFIFNFMLSVAIFEGIVASIREVISLTSIYSIRLKEMKAITASFFNEFVSSFKRQINGLAFYTTEIFRVLGVRIGDVGSFIKKSLQGTIAGEFLERATQAFSSAYSKILNFTLVFANSFKKSISGIGLSFAQNFNLSSDSITQGLKRILTFAFNVFSQIIDRAREFFRVLTVGSSVGAQRVSFFTKLKVQAEAVFDTLANRGLGVLGKISDALSKISSGQGVKGLSGIFRQTGKDVLDAATAFGKYERGLIGVSTNATIAGGALFILGSLLRESDSALLRFAGNVSFVLAAAFGQLGLVIQSVIISLGDFIFRVGSKLVEANQKALDSFINVQKQTFAFETIINGFNHAVGDSIGTIETWTEVIDSLNKTTGQTPGNLKKSAAEIVAATQGIGLNRKQMEELLKVAVDYNALIDGDLLDTTIRFINALNGNSQAVIAYGVKLDAATVASKILHQGINANFEALSESEKVQQRFNVLLEEYEVINGFASKSLSTLNGQQKLLKNNLDRVIAAFGRGTQLVEFSFIGYAALNTILDSVSENFITVAGAISGLIGRMVQGIGILLKFAFTVTIVLGAINALNSLLASQTAATLFNATLPLINKSIVQIIASAGVASVQLNSLGAVAKTVGNLIVAQTSRIIAGFIGVEVASLTLSGAIKGVLIRSLTLLGNALLFVARGFLAILANPIVLALSAIAAAGYAVFLALKEIELRTGALSTVWNVLSSALSATTPILDAVLSKFKAIGEFFKELASKIIGRLASTLISVLELFLKLAKLNPLGVFGKINQKEIQTAISSLASLDAQLIAVDFDIRKVEKSAKKLSEGVGKVDISALLKQLNDLKTDLKNVGQNDLNEVLKAQKDRLAIVSNSLRAGIIKEKEAATLRVKINRDASEKIQKIREEEEKRIQEIFKRSSSNPFEAIFDLTSGKIKLPQIDTKSGFFKGFQEFFKNLGDDAKAALAGIAAGFLEGISNGREGARKLVVAAGAEIAGAVGTAFGGPIVGQMVKQVAGPLFEILSKSKNEIRQIVQEFTAAIPEFVENIITNAPVLVEALIVGLTKAIERIADRADIIITALIENLIEALPRIVKALIIAMPKVAFALATAMPQVAVSFAVALVKEVPRIVAEFIKQIGKMFKLGGDGKDGGGLLGKALAPVAKIPVLGSVVQLAAAPIKTIASVFGKLPGIGGIFKKLGFADGGQIVKVPSGFPNDSFPARLTSGELVVSRSTTGKLEDFLNNKDKFGQDPSIAPILQLILQELKKPISVDGKITGMNNREFGRQLLTISRQNLRTT
jgi:hypothetical protein